MEQVVPEVQRCVRDRLADLPVLMARQAQEQLCQLRDA